MAQLFTNNASATLASPITSGDVTVSVGAGTGSKFPTISGTDFFMITLTSSDGTTQEIMKVTARSTDDLTVTRAQEGTSAAAFSAGATVKLLLTAGPMTFLMNCVYAAAIAAIQALTPAANKLAYFTSASAAALTDLSAFGRSLIDDADASAARTTLGLGTAATQASSAFLQASNNLSDVANAATARGNLSAAPLASPTFTGTPAAPTASYGTSTTQLASTAFVQAAIATRTDDGNTGTSKTIDFSTANIHKATLTGNCTFTFTAPPTGAVVVLELAQDGTGSRTVTWPAAVHWSGGTAPTLTTTASKVDIFTFYYNGTTYFGVTSGLNYTA